MSALGFSPDIPCGAAAESLVTFHCGQTIILGVGPSKTHARLLLTASPASLLPLQLEGKVSFPPQPGRNDTQNTNRQLSQSRGEASHSPRAGPCFHLDAEMSAQPSCVPHSGMGSVESHLAGCGNVGCAVSSWEHSRFCLNTASFQRLEELSPIPKPVPLLQLLVYSSSLYQPSKHHLALPFQGWQDFLFLSNYLFAFH